MLLIMHFGCWIWILLAYACRSVDFSCRVYIVDSENAIIPINFAPFIAAAVVFAFSFVFKYGVLLQEFSDETL